MGLSLQSFGSLGTINWGIVGHYVPTACIIALGVRAIYWQYRDVKKNRKHA
jgi:hypothetical protein